MTLDDFAGGTDQDSFIVQVSSTVVCGDGVVEGIEQCDDSNTMPGDGCSMSCQWETPVCGDFSRSVSPTT